METTSFTAISSSSFERKDRTVEDIFDALSVAHFQWDDDDNNNNNNNNEEFDHLLFGCIFLLQRCRVDIEENATQRSNTTTFATTTLDKNGRRRRRRKLTMGQKLKLAESVERGLEDVGCPLPLRAHQIVGLDLEHVFPVVQWLMKRAMAKNHEGTEEDDKWRRTRDGRRFSGSFCRGVNDEFVERDGKKSSLMTSTSTRRIERIQLNNNSVTNSTRTLRRTAESNINRDLEKEGEEKIINGCLMEFGHQVSGKSSLYYYYNRGSGAMAMRAAAAARNRGEKETNRDEGTSIGGGGGGEKEKEKETLNEEEEEEEEEEEVLKREEAKLKRMLSEYLVKNDENDENASSVSSNSVAELLVKMKSEEIANAMHAFGDDFDAASASGASTPFVGLSGAAGKVLRIERATRAVARRLEMEKRKLDAKQEEMDKAELETKQVKEAYENAKNENETVVAKRIELENSVTDPIQKQLVDALANMAKRRASLKKEEALFRKTCKKELKVLKAKVISIDAEREQSGELAKIAETSTQYAKEQEKRDKRIAELAKRSKKNAILSRRLDDVPHSAELAQYETRFRELKNAVTHKLRETKRLFALYNSLAKRSEHAAKEISLLTSVKEQLHLLDTKIGKQSLRDSLRDISSAVSKTADNTEKKKVNEKRAEELFAEDQREHIEKRKEYLRLTKEFKDLCKREERCVRRLEEEEEEENGDGRETTNDIFTRSSSSNDSDTSSSDDNNTD